MGDEDLLARMLRSRHGWKAADLDRLYVSYGLEKREGSKHTIYTHSADPYVLRATVARHTAIRLIRHLKLLEEGE